VTEPTPWLANDDALGWRYPIGAPSVMFADGHTYRLKLVSRDNVGNEEDPALKGMTNFLVDNTFPAANATTPGGLGFTEVDSVNLSGLAEDITPAGGLSQSSISAPTDVVFSIRQTDNFSIVTPQATDRYWDGTMKAPGTGDCPAGPQPCFGVLNTGLLNDGGTSLICSAPGVPANCRWMSATSYNPASHGWSYSGLGAGGTAWPRGKVYFVRARARDRAGNLMPPSDVPSPGYYFKVAAAAEKFKIETQQGPYTAGTAQNVTVTALDGLDNVASNFTDWVTFTSEDVGAPEVPGLGLPSNYQFNAADNGVHVFTLGMSLRRAGDGSAEVGPKRSIKVAKLSNSLINGTTGDITVSPDQAQCLVLALPGQSLSPGTNNGRSGSVSISTAGTPFSASVYVTDQFFNRVPSSAPATVTMTHNDPYAAQPVTSTFSNGLMTAQMTPRSKRGAWTVPGATANTAVTAAGAGNPGACAAGAPYGASVAVQAANTASKKLLLRLPGENLAPGSPTGKTASAPQEQQAASTFTATVYAA
ncbi:MAG: hypothetical protein AAB412_03130, partial [Elusimicrobiota bacterium]